MFSMSTGLNNSIKVDVSTSYGNTSNTFLLAVFCRRIRKGKYYVKIGEHEYEIYNYGYYAPDKCVWWEAINLKTNEAYFHEHSKSQLLKTMQRELS